MAMATKVYQLRLQRKLSQAELAVRAGVTQGVISRLETHDDYNVSAAALKGLAMALVVLGRSIHTDSGMVS